jgi:HEAT repeat protein
LQLLFTNRLIHRFGVPAVNLFCPLASLASFAGMIFNLGLPTAIAASVNTRSIMPAFHNPVRTIFLNTLPQHIQGRAHAMSLAIVLPVSLAVCGILLWFLQKLDNPLYFLIPGAVAAGAFVYFSIRMNRAYGETLLTHLKEHLFLPEEQSANSLKHTGKENLASIMSAVSRGDETSVSFARIMTAAYPQAAADHILPVIEHATPRVADQLLKVLSVTNDPAVHSFLVAHPNLHDRHFRATTLKTLASSRTRDAVPPLIQALGDTDPRIRATGIHGILSWPLVEHQVEAFDVWIALLHGSENEQLAALELIPDIKYIETPATRETIEQTCLTSCTRMFSTQSVAAKSLILAAYSHREGPGPPEILPLVNAGLEDTDPGVRTAAVQCVRLFPQDQRHDKLECALGDGHARVRNAAVDVLSKDTPDISQLALKWIFEDNRGTPRAQRTLLCAVIDSVPLSTLELVVGNKIEDARKIYRALVMIRRQGYAERTTFKLLEHLLGERFQQVLDIALTAMEPLCARGVISTIRAGIQTADDRYVANACEALHSIPHQKLTQPLGQLIQDAFMSARRTTISGTESLEAVLKSLTRRPDAWLQECARAALISYTGHSKND